MTMTPEARAILHSLVTEATRDKFFPGTHAFRARQADHVSALEELQADGLVRQQGRVLVPSLAGLAAAGSELATRERDVAAAVFESLRDRQQANPGVQLSSSVLADELRLDRVLVVRALEVLWGEGLLAAVQRDARGLPTEVVPGDRLSEVDPFSAAPAPLLPFLAERSWAIPLRRRLSLGGWGPFSSFEVGLDAFTVLVGANATGKSTLASALRWLGEMMVVPLPPEVVPGRGLKSVFRVGAHPRLTVAVTLEFEGAGILDYRCEVVGPEGKGSVLSEFVGVGADALVARERQVVRVRSLASGVSPVAAASNELYLRGAAAPGVLVAVREALRDVKVYGDADVSPQAPLRRPQLIEADAVLEERGDNLLAVLHRLRGDRQGWREIETLLATTVPGFLALDVRAAPTRGHVLLAWREEGIERELALPDLSDGTVRLLLILAACLGARSGSLLVFDEPEQGLHPRVLPVLAQVLLRTSERAQVLVLTHSPELLAQFPLSSARVLRRSPGGIEAASPGDSAALRALVQSDGGPALGELFRSEELEALS